MQIRTRTCTHHPFLTAASLSRFFAIVVLTLCMGVAADEVASRETASSLEQNQDPGRHSTRSLRIADTRTTERININSATVEELATALPGIGPGKAQNIVDWRNDNGVFQFLAQLLEVSGIGPKTLERIAPLIHFGDAQASVSGKTPVKNDAEHRWVLLDIVARAKNEEQGNSRD